jgi:uncharacterized membrane protein YbhN (UPF0104 family)
MAEDVGKSVSIDRAARPREDEAHEAGLPIPRLHGRLRYVVIIGFGLLLIVGVFLLVSKVAGYTKTLDSLKAASPIWLAVCFGSQVVSYAAYVVLFRTFAELGAGPRPPVWLASRIVFAALGATRLLAAGGAGGIAVFYWAFRQLGFGGHKAVVRVFALNTALYATFGAATFIAALALLLGLGEDVPLAMTLPWIAALGLLALLGAAVTRPDRAARLMARSEEGRLRRAAGGAVEGAQLVRSLAEEPRANRATLAAAPLYWFGDMSCLWAGLRAFDIALSPQALVLAYATGFLANMLPLPTGGIGGVDAATTFALTVVGVPLSAALLGVFTYRFFSFLLPTLPAVIAIPGLPRAGRELRALAPDAAA